MRPCPLRDHPRQDKTRELVHAEDVRREDQFQRLARDIFGRAGHAVAAIVEQCVERSARDLHGLAPSLFDARRIAVVDPNAVEPVGLPRGHVLGLAAGGDHAPAPVAQRMRSREADTGEHPVMRMLRVKGAPCPDGHRPRLVRRLKEILGHVSRQVRFQNAEMRPAVADPLDQLDLGAERQRRENGVVGRRAGAEIDPVAGDAQKRAGFRGAAPAGRPVPPVRCPSTVSGGSLGPSVRTGSSAPEVSAGGRFTRASSAVSAAGSITRSMGSSSPVGGDQNKPTVRGFDQRIVRRSACGGPASRPRDVASATLSCGGHHRGQHDHGDHDHDPRGSASVGSCLWPAPWFGRCLHVAPAIRRGGDFPSHLVSIRRAMSACWSGLPALYHNSWYERT
jgi:hypothetical protein